MLNAAQRRFCQEYLIDLNATRAYKAAYPTASDRSARAAGARLLADVSITGEIQRLQAARAERVGVTTDRVLTELSHLAFSDIGEAFDEQGNLRPIHELPANLRRALSGMDLQVVSVDEFEGVATGTEDDDEPKIVNKRVTVRVRKVRLWDKVKALELLGRHLGLWGEDNADRAPLQVSVLVHPNWAAANPEQQHPGDRPASVH